MNIVTDYHEDERGFLIFHQYHRAKKMSGDPNHREYLWLTAIFTTKKIKISYHGYMNLLEKHI